MKILAAILLLSLQQELTLPKEVKTPVGAFVSFTAETKGSEVKFVVLTDGLQVLDKNLLKDPKTFVCFANKPGNYKILAYTAVDNKLSDPVYTVIKAGDTEPEPNNNQLKEIVQAVYGADQTADKVLSKDKILNGFLSVNKVKDSLNTVSDLNKTIKDKIKLAPDEAQTLRGVISDHLKASFGTNPSTVLDKEQVAKVLNDIIDSLKSL
jgi:hypothetical protein